MKLDLNEDVACIVGGAKGIGYAIAQHFAAEGADVALIDVDPDVSKAGEALANQHKVSVFAQVGDVTNAAAMRAVIEDVRQQLGGLHHVVYAAGCGSGKYGFPFWNLDPSDWSRVLEVNLLGAVNVLHAVAPTLTAQERGTVLFLSSIAGQIGSQTDPPYSAAKAGLINFAQCAAKDLAEYNVRLNTVCPGMIQTTVNRSVWKAWHDQQPAEARLSYDDWAGEKVKRVAPLKRWQTVDDVAALAVFLASPRAENITGQTMNVDGGQVMHW